MDSVKPGTAPLPTPLDATVPTAPHREPDDPPCPIAGTFVVLRPTLLIPGGPRRLRLPGGRAAALVPLIPVGIRLCPTIPTPAQGVTQPAAKSTGASPPLRLRGSLHRHGCDTPVPRGELGRGPVLTGSRGGREGRWTSVFRPAAPPGVTSSRRIALNGPKGERGGQAGSAPILPEGSRGTGM